MSLNIYKFSDKSGTVTVEQRGKEFVMPIYGEGKTNCYLACLWESEPDAEGLRSYQPYWFFNDESDAKRMLGLTKSRNGSQENYLCEITKITLFKDQCAHWKKIMAMFADAFEKIEITIMNRSDAE